jgi:DNA-binding transcriptional MerR regulator
MSDGQLSVLGPDDQAGSMSIGEVITTLKPEFPDLTVSKIRFLESQGLIEPHRSPSGYRMFSADDLHRIEYILREQRDHFLPLKVITSNLVRHLSRTSPPRAFR